MTDRERRPIVRDEESLGPEPKQCDASVTERRTLAKYLGYALPEVAAINPTSALLLDQAIAELIQAPEAADDRKYS